MSSPNLLSLLLSDFNSIKVRLERFLLMRRMTLAVFQFHKGAIRTTATLVDIFQTMLISIP